MDLAMRVLEQDDVVRVEQVLEDIPAPFQQACETGHLRGLYRRKAMPFRGHSDKVYAVAFSPDHKRIVSSSGDDTVKVWDDNDGPIAPVFSARVSALWHRD